MLSIDVLVFISSLLLSVVVACFLLPKLRHGQSCCLRILSWNILAPIWINRANYEFEGIVDLNLLNVEKRLMIILDRLVYSDADIITLQEIQQDQYDVICKEMQDGGLGSAGFFPHRDGYWSNKWLPADTVAQRHGQAVFLRKGKFNIVQKENFFTSDDGNVAAICVLEIRKPFSRVLALWSSPVYVILVNCHLESSGGTQDEKACQVVVTRLEQIKNIHDKCTKLMENIKDKESNSIVHLIWAGDFNSYPNRPGMKEVERLGYADVAKIVNVDNVQATFYPTGLQLDHVLLLKSDFSSGKITPLSYFVPDVTSPEYSEERHVAHVILALSNYFKRKSSSYKEIVSYMYKSKILSRIRGPDGQKRFEATINKALRIGSDHLPLQVELKLETS